MLSRTHPRSRLHILLAQSNKQHGTPPPTAPGGRRYPLEVIMSGFLGVPTVYCNWLLFSVFSASFVKEALLRPFVLILSSASDTLSVRGRNAFTQSVWGKARQMGHHPSPDFRPRPVRTDPVQTLNETIPTEGRGPFVTPAVGRKPCFSRTAWITRGKRENSDMERIPRRANTLPVTKKKRSNTTSRQRRDVPPIMGLAPPWA